MPTSSVFSSQAEAAGAAGAIGPCRLPNRRRVVAAGLAGFAALLATVDGARAQLTRKFAEDLENGEFNWFPERSPGGPIVVIVSLPDQLLHVYRNGIRIAASTCSTGKAGHRTPTGVFTILQKDKHHRSSTYNNAPMPNMNRLTWSGIALHAGDLPGYPASHGCVRLPLAFSERLFAITRLGMTVVIADDRSFPAPVVHPGMVLGAYVASEFHAVAATLVGNAYRDRSEPAPRTSAFVVSSKDRRLTVLQDGRPVAAAPVAIRNPEEPLGERAYTLVGSDGGASSLTWSAASLGADPASDPASVLARIAADIWRWA
jgi:hypothetical protein